jgi:hypothetical protein
LEQLVQARRVYLGNNKSEPVPLHSLITDFQLAQVDRQRGLEQKIGIALDSGAVLCSIFYALLPQIVRWVQGGSFDAVLFFFALPINATLCALALSVLGKTALQV